MRRTFLLHLDFEEHTPSDYREEFYRDFPVEVALAYGYLRKAKLVRVGVVTLEEPNAATRYFYEALDHASVKRSDDSEPGGGSHPNNVE